MIATPSRPPLLLAAVLTAGGLAVTASSEQAPDGPEFQVNTYTTGHQNSPRVVAGPNDEYLVVWADDRGDVMFQVYDSSGGAVGGEHAAATAGVDDQPAAAFQPSGDIVIAWHNGGSIMGQRFDQSGAPLGPIFQVGSGSYGPAVDTDAGGGFVVVWDGGAIKARQFSTVGVAVDAEFEVESNFGSQPDLAVSDSGDFVVAWHDNALGGGAYDVFAQRVTSAGALTGPMLVVNSSTAQAQRHAKVDNASNGDFVVIWNDGASYDVRGQRFAADGTPQGSEFVANADTSTAAGLFNGGNALTVRDDGSFVVAWSTNYTGADLKLREFDSSGTALTANDVTVNTTTDGVHVEPSMAARSGGRFVVAWTNRYSYSSYSGGDSDGSDRVLGQRFGSADSIFADGFEGGTTGAWSGQGP